MAILSFFLRLCGPPPCKNDPQLTPNDGKLIFEFGQKWSRGDLEVVRGRWFLFSQQNHIVLTGTCCSGRIMIVCQDHDPLPGSSSSAKIMILFQQHHDFCMVILPRRFPMTDTNKPWSYYIYTYIYIWPWLFCPSSHDYVDLHHAKMAPNSPTNGGKLIWEFGRNGPEVVPRWSLNNGSSFPNRIMLFWQEHTGLTQPWSSARIIILCQDHHPLPRSWSSAKDHDPPSTIL